MCVTDSEARTARGQPFARSPRGPRRRAPAAAAASPSPGALPGGDNLSGLAARPPPPPSWRVGYITWSLARTGSNPAAAAGSSPGRGVGELIYLFSMRCPLQRSSGGRARAGAARREARVLLSRGCCRGAAEAFSTGAGGRGLRRRRLPGCPTRLRGAGGGAAPGPGRRGWSRRPRGRWDRTGCTGPGRAGSAGTCVPGAAVSAPRRPARPAAPGAPRTEPRPGDGRAPHFWQGEMHPSPPSHPDLLLFDTEAAKYFTLKAVCALWSTESLKHAVSVSSC